MDLSETLRQIFGTSRTTPTPAPAARPTSGFARKDLDLGGRKIALFETGEERCSVPALIANRYEIEDVLSNRGGYGVIYYARDRELGNRRCLVKAVKYSLAELRAAAQNDPSEMNSKRRAAQNECRALLVMQERGEGRVPNLLRLVEDIQPALYMPEFQQYAPLDPQVADHEPYMILQYVPGKNLKDVIQAAAQARAGQGGRSDPQWWSTALKWTRELCSILNTVHRTEQAEDPSGGKVERGFLYNDLKPENCIVTNDEFITLIDFGGVRQYWRPVVAPPAPDWESEEPVYTPGYVAPEAVNPHWVRYLDPRVDIYSVGAMLWEMLAGVSPTKLADRSNLSPTLTDDDPRLPADLPSEVREVLRRSLQRERDSRPSTAKELKDLTIAALRMLGKAYS